MKYRTMQNINQYIRQSLKGIYPETEIKSLAKIILQDALGFNLLDLYGGKDRNLSEKEATRLDGILQRLQKNEPIQYILEQAEFCGLTFRVTPYTLIPRPETEELVLLIARENNQRPVKILDIGTGSGCIAIALAKQLPQAEVTAWDVSGEALQIATLNSRELNAKVCFKQTDVLTAPAEKATFDVIVSNPPYVTVSEKAEMEAHVLNWEPALALFVPDENPLLFYYRIAYLGLEMLTPNGKLYFEINQVYGKETAEMLRQAGYSQIELMKDIFTKDRIIKATR